MCNVIIIKQKNIQASYTIMLLYFFVFSTKRRNFNEKGQRYLRCPLLVLVGFQTASISFILTSLPVRRYVFSLLQFGQIFAYSTVG